MPQTTEVFRHHIRWNSSSENITSITRIIILRTVVHCSYYIVNKFVDRKSFNVVNLWPFSAVYLAIVPILCGHVISLTSPYSSHCYCNYGVTDNVVLGNLFNVT